MAKAHESPLTRSIRRSTAVGRWSLLGVLVGALAGLGAVVFHLGLEWVTAHVFEHHAGHHPPHPAGEVRPDIERTPMVWWLWIALPAAGALLAGVLVYTLCPQAEGEGTDAMIRSFHREKGRVGLRVFWVKLIASVATIGSGGSAGREGPSTQIGSALGSSVARALRLSERDRRVLLLAGASAGVGAIFRAPLGGALFAGEVLYRETDSEGEALIPCLVAAITAYAVFLALMGSHNIFAVPACSFAPLDLLWYGLLGCLCAGTGWLYVKTMGAARAAFRRLRLPRVCKPALGGALLGAFALLVAGATGNPDFNVFGGGHGLIQVALDAQLTLRVCLVLVLAKIVATALTVGSGGAGGLFAPSLVIGALVGGAVGQALHALGYVDHVAPFVLVGMGGFFAGVGKVPITSVVMVSEITKGYELLAPLMLAAAVSFLLSRRFTLFEEQVATRLHSPAHAGDFVVDVLAQMRVRDVFDPHTLPTLVAESTPLRDVLQQVAESASRYFPVVDDDGRMVGIFSLTDIRRVMTETALADLVVARELATEDVLTVTADTDLNTALRRFTQKNIDELPVVDPEDRTRVLGMLSRKDVIGAYGRRLDELRRAPG